MHLLLGLRVNRLLHLLHDAAVSVYYDINWQACREVFFPTFILYFYQIQSDWWLVLFLKTLILINSLFLLTVHSRRILHMQFLSFNACMPRWSRALLVSTVDDSTSQRWPHAHSKDSKKGAYAMQTRFLCKLCKPAIRTLGF